MKMIVGLGNPGKEYENTRHNIGFMILDSYISNANWQKKFDGLYQILSVENEKVLFLKPMTYMNLSGVSVQKAMKYYSISIEDLLIIQDDMDLNFGTFKLKKNSSAGGHNGIKSIISALKSDSFSRLKIGISHDKFGNTIHHVLGKLSKEELKLLESSYVTYKQIINSFISNGIDQTMNKFN